MLGLGGQGKMFFLAKEGWWNWQMRIVVAKKNYSARLPTQSEAERVCEGRATANAPCILKDGFKLPCFASPFGACVTVHLFLKTCAVQTVRAEELWACCKKVKQETRQVSGFKKTGGCYFKAQGTELC